MALVRNRRRYTLSVLGRRTQRKISKVEAGCESLDGTGQRSVKMVLDYHCHVPYSAETLPLGAVRQEIRMVITYNEPVTFGRHGTARNLNCTGIDFLEDGNQSWTSAPVAELDIQLPFARQDVLFELDATPFIIPDVVSAQKVFIFVGGMFVGYCSLTDHDVRTFPVNRNVISGRAARLSLVIPTATSPNSLRMSEDMRELGICLNAIAFKTGM